MSSPQWCLGIAAGLCTLTLWSPVICLSGLFLYLGISNYNTFLSCERPLAIWALAGGSVFGSAVVVWLVGLAVASASCLQTDREPGIPRGQPGKLARMFLGKPAFEALASLRSSPTVCATVERSFQAILVLAMAAWLVVGAVWVWPLHDSPHHCNPALISVSFYVVIGLVVVLLIIAVTLCILCTCLAVCGLSLRGAVDGVVEMIHGILSMGDESVSKPSKSSEGPSPLHPPLRSTAEAIAVTMAVDSCDLAVGSSNIGAPAATTNGDAVEGAEEHEHRQYSERDQLLQQPEVVARRRN